MPLTALIVSGGIYLMLPGGVEVGYLPLSTPHPYGVCQEDRDRAMWLKHRLQQILEGPPQDIKGTLIQEGLAKEYPYDWCIPKYEIRHTIGYWVTSAQVFNNGPIRPPKRPDFIARRPKANTIPVKLTSTAPRGNECQRSSTCAPASRPVTPVIRPSAIPTPPCILNKRGDGKPSAGCISVTVAPKRSG
jgi:hypothetical protein